MRTRPLTERLRQVVAAVRIGLHATAAELNGGEASDERDRLATLAELSGVLATFLDVRTLVERTADVLARRLGGTVAVIALGDNGLVDELHTSPAGTPATNRLAGLLRQPLEDTNAALSLVATAPDNRTTLVHAADDPALRAAGFAVAAVVALRSRGSRIGALVAAREVGSVDERTLALLGEVASVAGPAIDNARLHREVRAKEAALRVSEEIQPAQDDAAVEGLIVVSAAGEILSYNQRFAEMWSIPIELLERGRDDEALAMATTQLADPESFLAVVRAAYANPDGPVHDEVVLADGRVFDGHGAPLHGRDGTYLGWAWYFRDLTEERAVQRSLAESRERFATLARTLQRSLLPPALPHIEGIDLAARYHPLGAGDEVGGDFYDIFPIGDRTWGVLLGDVCGSGPEAARLTALARYTVRAAAVQSTSPDVALEAVNGALLNEPADTDGADPRFITAVLAYITANNGTIDATIASAGHLPPLVVRRDTVDDPGIRGALLGVVDDAAFPPGRVHLAPGEALVLYTDGVTEARNPTRHLFGDEALRELLALSVGVPADELAGRIERAAVDYQHGETSDDIAVLVVAAPAE